MAQVDGTRCVAVLPCCQGVLPCLVARWWTGGTGPVVLARYASS